MINSKTPSQVFSTTLPTKPSQTTTSAAPLVNVAALDVADELLAQRAGVEQGVGVLGQFVALLLLLANVHQADGRRRPLQDVAGEDAAHDAVLKQMLGLGAGLAPTSMSTRGRAALA